MRRLCRNWLALSVTPAACHLSQRESPWQAGQLCAGRPRSDMAQKGGPRYRGQRLLDNAPCQAAAALDSGALQPTKRINFARSVGTWPICQRLSLWESWREAPERARTLTEKRKHSDSIVLTEESAHRCAAALTCRACPLRHCFAMTPLPEGEALASRATFRWTLKARYGAKGRALLQRAAASGQRTLSSCRCPRQRSTTVSETSCFARPDES